MIQLVEIGGGGGCRRGCRGFGISLAAGAGGGRSKQKCRKGKGNRASCFLCRHDRSFLLEGVCAGKTIGHRFFAVPQYRFIFCHYSIFTLSVQHSGDKNPYYFADDRGIMFSLS